MRFIAVFWVCLLIGCTRGERDPATSNPSDFFSLCVDIAKNRGDDSSFCGQLKQTLFKSSPANKAISALAPSDVGAPNFGVDKKIQYALLIDPNYLSGVAYCYFVFRGWIDSSKISPDNFGLLASGVSILNEEIEAYQIWLDSSQPGKECKTRVEKTSGVPITKLKSALTLTHALIFLNPISSVFNGAKTYEAVLQDLRVTLNHERIHVYQALCPSFDNYGQKMWMKLSPTEQSKFAQVYPSYNWNDIKVAGREYAAFSFENKPERTLEHVKVCNLK